MELANTRGRSTAPSNHLVLTMRHHPLLCYFLLAFGFTWVWEIPLVAIWHQVIPGPWFVLGPTLAGFAMAGITEGRAGLIRLLRRCVIWRVGLPWYLMVLLFVPAVWLVSILFMPGASLPFAFRAPPF